MAKRRWANNEGVDDFFNALTDILGSEANAYDGEASRICKQCHDVIDGPNTPDLCNSCFYLNIIGMEDVPSGLSPEQDRKLGIGAKGKKVRYVHPFFGGPSG
tara:strand:+ start:65 stop:370 length:306 start_codon:yes stop_codon:yes gene_type:complete